MSQNTKLRDAPYYTAGFDAYISPAIWIRYDLKEVQSLCKIFNIKPTNPWNSRMPDVYCFWKKDKSNWPYWRNIGSADQQLKWHENEKLSASVILSIASTPAAVVLQKINGRFSHQFDGQPDEMHSSFGSSCPHRAWELPIYNNCVHHDG